MIVVSPWSRGGWVNSQLFDHTSLIRVLETRFAGGNADLIESNITPWRRAVVGDLTSAFNFRSPNTATVVDLPSTDDVKPVDLVRYTDQVPVPPTDPRLPSQERGVRPARAIPYTLHANGRADRGSFRIELSSTGGAAAVFQVRSADPSQEPRSYTVESGKVLADTWDAGSGYDLSVHGPNGFFRRFNDGGDRQPRVDIRARYDDENNEIALDVVNTGPVRLNLTAFDRYTSRDTKLSVKPGDNTTQNWSLSRTRNWYDLTITVRGDPQFEYRYAGHLENGEESISDPGMGGLV